MAGKKVISLLSDLSSMRSNAVNKQSSWPINSIGAQKQEAVIDTIDNIKNKIFRIWEIN